ncbi:hypothetical protein ACS0TY_036999 [Phlomoides rotata]
MFGTNFATKTSYGTTFATNMSYGTSKQSFYFELYKIRFNIQVWLSLFIRSLDQLS